jgi:hypothetical protein
MAKVIRSTYPVEFSVGLLILIFVLSFFLSSQIFYVRWRELMDGTNVYLGMFLVSSAVIIMVLILWEEFLFPIHIKPGPDGVIFHNHRTKLITQLFLYLVIPAIFVFIYLYFQDRINTVRFIIWAAICTLMPVIVKLASGLNNYNDFLKLTNELIEYKNNKKSGIFYVKDIQRITPVRDERQVLHKVEVATTQGSRVLIDLDEMELEAFLDSIDQFIVVHYPTLVREKTA